MPPKKDSDDLDFDSAIERAARAIREDGHVEKRYDVAANGARTVREIWHPPWDARTERRRRVQCYRVRPPEILMFSLLDLIEWPISDKASLLSGEPMETWEKFKKQNQSRA
ncbi:MAG: hypothetical protein WCY09_08595 [Candidatus Omnitrophota bacterium]|jgi:hypothetical protein